MVIKAYLFQIIFRIGSTHSELLRLVHANGKQEAESKLNTYMKRMYQKTDGFEMLEIQPLTIGDV